MSHHKDNFIIFIEDSSLFWALVSHLFLKYFWKAFHLYQFPGRVYTSQAILGISPAKLHICVK